MDHPVFSVEGKICLITGVSSGLGAHFAQLLLERGAIIVGVSKTQCRWNNTHYKDQFSHIKGDITQEETRDKTLEHIANDYGQLDVLINNAGISKVQKAISFDADTFQDTMAINVAAAGALSGKAAQMMKAQENGGSIINVTSVMANSTLPGLSTYAASKAALEQLSKSMAAEFARHKIRVNCISPGWFPTPMTRERFEKGMDGFLKARIPLGRLGQENDLDGALLLLASDASRYMTGAVISVDGGYSVVC